LLALLGAHRILHVSVLRVNARLLSKLPSKARLSNLV